MSVAAAHLAATEAAVRALTAPKLAGVVDLVAWPQGERGRPDAVIVASADGAVRLTVGETVGETAGETAGGRHEVLHGIDPVLDTNPLAFLPYAAELADPSPDRARNAYPEPARRLLSLFSDADRSPDLAIVHTPRHYFPDEGGHRGEHGSLDVIQSRAPLVVAGAGVARLGLVDDWARILDVAPTLLLASGVDPASGGPGRPMEGEPLARWVEAGRRPVIGVLLDGAHCGDLLHLAGAGELPAIARLISSGTALRGGALAEFPSVTLCNHTSALTGVGPGRHGVLGNVFYDRATGARVVPNDSSTWHRSGEWLRPGALTVFERLRAARPGASCASVNEAIDRGATSSTMALVRAMGGDGGASGLDGALPPAEGSAFVGERAHLADDYYRWATRVDDAGVIQLLGLWARADQAPELTWWSHVVTDAGHHAGGPRSPIARDSLRDADRRLGALLDHLDALGVTDDVTFLLTADHGFEGADESRTGSWASALHAALDPLGVPWRDEGPGFVYLPTQRR